MLWPLMRSLAFLLDAESAHLMTMQILKQWTRFYDPKVPCFSPKLKRHLLGLRFKHPLGLAAGFDKNAENLLAWQALGFSFVEVGTLTFHPQPGNPRPRLFRLLKDEAIFNRMGFNNEGAQQVAARIAVVRGEGRLEIPVGVNIGKSKITPLEEAAKDYLGSFQMVQDVADYIVVNVSSPNTPGLRHLQEAHYLHNLLGTLSQANQRRKKAVPLLLKIAPDLSDEAALEAARIAHQQGFLGLIVSNTTIHTQGLLEAVPQGGGGLSGRPLFKRSTDLLAFLKREAHKDLVFVGVGGVRDKLTADAKLEAGADLVQSYTGFVYGGPFFIKKCINIGS